MQVGEPEKKKGYVRTGSRTAHDGETAISTFDTISMIEDDTGNLRFPVVANRGSKGARAGSVLGGG